MRFLKTSLVIAGLALSLSLFAENEIPAESRQGSFAVGCQAWTFRMYSALEAVEKTAQCGGKVIEFFPGQKFSTNRPDWKLDHNASEEMLAQLKAQLEKHHIRAVNYGVVNIPADEAEARKIFAFAKKLNLYAITTESEKSLDVIEKLVKEFDIRVGIHEHAKRPNDASYKLWDPNYVAGLIKDRDLRIGACADTGHWVRSGLKPVECLQALRGRVISVHLKDLVEFGKVEAHDVPFGTGVSDIPAILNELKDMGFNGNVSVEYEYNWETSMPDVSLCVGYVRGYGTAKNW